MPANPYPLGMKTSAVVSKKGQVTIPWRLRTRLGLVPGTVLLFEEREGQLVATRASRANPLHGLLGLGEQRGVAVDRWLAAARGPARARKR